MQQISASSKYTAMLSTYFCYFILLAQLALANTPDPGVHLGKRGFNATFFKYELGSDMGWHPGYFKQISKSSLGLETVGKVVDMNIPFEPQAENPNFHNVYQSKQSVTNMGLRLTAFFRPHASGYYRFNLATKDGAQLTIGPIRWPCHEEKVETHNLKVLRALEDQSKVSTKLDDFHLIKDFYYPVEVIAFNSQGNAILELSVTDPQGNVYADFGCLVYQGTFDKCGTSSKASSNSVLADASLLAKELQRHSQAAPPPMLHGFSSVHGKGYEESSLIKDRSGQRSFDSTDSVVNAQIGNTEHLKSDDSMVLGRPIIAPEYFDSWGFNIDEYKYSVGGKQGWEPDYFTSPRTGEIRQTLKNIVFINYDSRHPGNRIYSSRYGSRPKSIGFAAEMSGYFKATMAGMYKFELTADDGAYINIGPAEIPCGRRKRGGQSIFEMTALTELTRYEKIQETNPVVSHGSVPLQKDMYYPVKVIMFSSQGNSSLQLSVKDPSGLRISDFGNLVFQARDECGSANMAVSDSLMKTHGRSVETQNRSLSNSNVSFYKVNIKYTTSKNVSADTDKVIIQGGLGQSSIHVHILNTTVKATKKPDQLSAKVPGIMQTQESGPDPLSPSELAASGEIEDEAKLSRQFRDTTDPKKQTKPQPVLKQDESTRESGGLQALSDFQNSAALQVPSKLVDQGAPEKNDTSSGVVDKLLEAATSKKNETEPGVGGVLPTSAMTKNNETKPGIVDNKSKASRSKNNDKKPGVVEESSTGPTSDVSKNNQPKPDVVQAPPMVMDKKDSNKNETETSVVEESSTGPTSDVSKSNRPKPDVVQAPPTVMDKKDSNKNETETSVVEEPPKEPTSDVSETSDPNLEVAKDLSEVSTPDITQKNDGKSSNFVNQNGPEENDPKKESSGEPPDALMKEVSNENNADSVVSEKSSKIVIHDNLVNSGVTGEILQDSSKESSPDSVTDHDSTPDVLEVALKNLEPHDQKLNESVVELNPLLREEQTKDESEPGAFEAPLALVSENLTAATPIVDAPADSNKSISVEVKASSPFASGVSLRVDPAVLNSTLTPEVESADAPIIAKENISANSGSEIPVPKDFEVSASLDSAEPAFSNNSMPAQSVVQMPVPSEIIAEIVPKNETSADLNERVPANPEDPMPDGLNESMPATLPAEALAVSGAPLPIAPEDVLEDIPIETSMGIASVSAAYRFEKALPSHSNDSKAEISEGFRPAVLEVPLLATPQNLSPVIANFKNSELANETLPMVANSESLMIAIETLPAFPNLENLVIANKTLPVVAKLEYSVIANETLPVVANLQNLLIVNETLPSLPNLENLVIANKTLPVVAIDEAPETPASEAPIVSIAKVSELKSGASEDPLSLIEFNGSMSGPTRFQEANPGSVKQVLRDNNSTTTSHSDHGTQVEAFQKESELMPDELGTFEVVSDKRLQGNKPPDQVQRKPHSQSDQPSLLDDAAQSNSAHGKTGEVVVHIAQDAEIKVGNPGSSTLNGDSNPQKSTSNSTTESFTGNRKEPSTPKPSKAGTMAPVSACLGNNCSSEAAIDNLDAPPSMKGDGLETASAHPRMLTLVSHATSAYPSSMPSGEPTRVIMFSDGSPKKIPMFILSAIALEVMIMIL